MEDSIDWEARWKDANTPWDKGTPAPPLAAYFDSHPAQGRILVPGCGSGHEVRLVASTADQVVGIDLSATGIATAEKLPKTGSEFYQVANLFDLPDEFSSSFDTVIEHTCFCAIDPSKRPDYVKAVRSALKPSGQLIALFYMTPQHDDGPPFGTTREELKNLFAKDFELLSEEIPKIGFEGRLGHELLQVLKARPL